MSRRDKGEGSISQRKDGSWTARIDIGVTPDGKRKIKAFYGKTENEVKKKLREFKKELAKNEYQEIKKITVSELANEWLATKLYAVKAGSYDRIEATLNNQIIPLIGHYQIVSVTPNDIQFVINSLIEQEYSYSIMHKTYNAMNAFFKYACDKQYLHQTPVKNIVMPKQKQKQKGNIEYFNDDEVSLIIQLATEQYKTGKYIYKHGYAFPLLLNTGMRIGELLALKWESVDFDNKQIHIIATRNQTIDRSGETKRYVVADNSTKTSSGYRTIPMNQQAYECLMYFKNLGYNNGYVMANSNNNVVSYRNINRALSQILKKAKINHGSPHSLRHTFATKLFQNGVDAKVISDLLGHSDISITYNIYTHVIKEQKMKAVQSLNDIF